MSVGLSYLQGRNSSDSIFLTTSLSTTTLNFEDTYHKSIEDLKTHLMRLANPLIATDVLSKLANISKKSLDTTRGILEEFSKLVLSEQLDRLIHELNEQILREAKKHLHSLDDAVTAIKKDLSLLSKIKREETLSLWPELKDFFDIPQIRSLEDEIIKTFIYLINKNDFYNLVDVVGTGLKNNLESVNQQLEKTRYKNLNTLLSQIIEQKPKLENSLLTFWEQPDSYFEKKTLYFNSPNTMETIHGIIEECKINRNEKVFYLKEAEVHISTNFLVKIIKKTAYRLWNAIDNGTLDKHEFEITNPTDRQIVEDIAPGIYEHGSVAYSGSYLPLRGSFSRTLELTVENRKKYKIVANFQSDKDKNPRIILYHFKDRDYVKLRDLHASELNTIIAIKREIISTAEINKDNIDKHIKIKNEENENKVKLHFLEKLREKIEELRKELIDIKHQSLLNKLLDNLVSNQLKKIDLAILGSPNFIKKLKDISQQYQDHLKMDYKPEDILKKVVEEANYAILVDKQQSAVVSRTMELLKDAFYHLEKIRGKKSIFFMGKTGAGKSSGICYCLGIPLIIDNHIVGDRIVKIQAGFSSQANFPKIGQSLGESETLYAQGYELTNQNPDIDPDIILVDCPGVDDTRGSDYALCTNLSIDEAVKLSKSIKTIVIILPIHDFLSSGRSSSLLDLVDTIQERFPLAFDPEHPVHSSNIFLMITKDMQAQPETVEKLKDGTRINELVRESQEKLRSLTESHQQGVDIEFELSTVKRKYNIWRAIQQMHFNNQIDVVNFTDRIIAERLLKKYIHSPSEIKKESYVPAMRGEGMQLKFGKYVEMSTHTWTHRVFKEYLEVLPAKIEESASKIKNHAHSITEIETAIQKRNDNILQLQSSLASVNTMIKELNDVKKDPRKLRESYHQELEGQIKNSTTARLIKMQKEKVEMEESLKEKDNELKKINTKIKKLKKENEKKTNAIEKLKQEIDTLSTGEKTDLLKEVIYKANKVFKIFTYKTAETRKKVFDEMRPPNDDEITNIETVNTNTFEGTLGVDVIIERKYKLVPTDKELKKKFLELRKVTEVFENGKYSGQYIAEIKGFGYQPALGWKTSPDGKKIIYSFNLEFNGDGKFPWFRIDYTTPCINVNEATIINKSAEITVLEKELANLTVELEGGEYTNGKEKEKTELVQEITDLGNEIEEKNSEIIELENSMAVQKVEVMLQQQQKEATRIEDELKKLRSSKQLESKKEKLLKEKAHEEEHLKTIQKTKRNLAMIIYSQKGTARLLKKFADLAIHGSDSGTFGEKRNAMIISCQGYIKVFKENIIKVMAEVCKELGVSPINPQDFLSTSTEVEYEYTNPPSHMEKDLEVTSPPPPPETPRQKRAKSKRSPIDSPDPVSSSRGKREKQETPPQNEQRILRIRKRKEEEEPHPVIRGPKKKDKASATKKPFVI